MSGTHSVVLVTVPNSEVGKKIAQYEYNYCFFVLYRIREQLFPCVPFKIESMLKHIITHVFVIVSS